MATSVMVLMGGWSSEREVSLVSGKHIAEALTEAGYDVRTHDLRRDIPALIAALTPPPDVVFNALHGRFGEDGTVQGLLELLGARYTHSGVLASALAMDKPMAKRLFTEAGIRCAEHVVASREDALSGAVMDPPYVIKPLNEGSSVGVKIVLGEDAVEDDDASFPDVVMVERLIMEGSFVQQDPPLTIDRTYSPLLPPYPMGSLPRKGVPPRWRARVSCPTQP